MSTFISGTIIIIKLLQYINIYIVICFVAGAPYRQFWYIHVTEVLIGMYYKGRLLEK